MDRRTVLKGLAGVGSLAATGGLSMPALSQGAAARTLRFVPQANLANFDPIWGTQYVVRNAAALVWDTLYGVDAKPQPQRQMVESEEVSDDGLVWTFRLRPGLKFHDGEPVLSKDVVASIARWSARDPMGLMLKAIQNELVAVDDKTFKWSLKTPFSKMLMALGKNSTPCAFIMPERIAQTDPFKQIPEYIGSGPMKFAKSEWVPGHRPPTRTPAAWFLPPGHASQQRRGRKNLKGKARSRGGKETAREERLFDPAVSLRGAAVSANHQGFRRCHRRSAEADGH